MSIKLKNKAKIMGLDVSSKTVGVAIFDMTGLELLELTHVSPKIKPQPEDKIEELIKKADIFEKFLESYINMGICKIIIEQPLLSSNNIFTVGVLLRFNTMILMSCYKTLGVIPTFISTYDSRKFAFPDLVGPNDKGKLVLFGGYPKDIDKKKVIWEHVNSLFPEAKWLYDKNGKFKKENYDISDAVTCVIGFINKNNIS